MKTRTEILDGLNEAQKSIVTKINGKYAVVAAPGSGKALKNSTLVQTPSGPKPIGDMTVGDKVFGTDGKVYNVTAVHPQGLKKVWEVDFSEGTTIEACEDHLWTFENRNNRRRHRGKRYETMTTKEIYENIDLYKYEGKSEYRVSNVFMPDVLPAEHEEKELELDPYFLGLLLGDGGFRGSAITFSNSEEDILSKFNLLVEKYGDRVADLGDNDYQIRTVSWRETFVRDILKGLKLYKLYSHEKFIPEKYLLASVEQRLELLKGLIDTDAHCSGSSYEYTTSSEQLALDIKRLVQSLGMTATVGIKEKPTYQYKGKQKIGKPSYRIRIKTSKEIPKIHTSEKHELSWNQGQSSARITMTDIRPTEKEVEMTCISVDSPNNLFLIEDFIPTHNTHSMISRAEYLILSGVKPWEILMITFTRKAANEISQRLTTTIGEEAVEVDTGTFHSIALRILLTNQVMLGYDKSITVIDEDESLSIISDLAVSHGYSSDEGGREIKDYIENWQTESQSPEDIEALNKFPEDIVIIYKEYQALKKSIGYIDFNDILNLTVYLLEKFPNIREKYSRQYKHIIIDEGQDSSEANLRLVELLSEYHGNFMMVMDDEQSIYGFRGANLEAVLGMLKKYEDLEVLKMEQNYRSTKTIVNAANALIDLNSNQLKKTSFTENNKGAPIFAYDATDEVREAEFVSTMIQTLVGSGKYNYDDIMILYRSHWKSKAVEAGLNSKSIPYSIIGGTEFYEREDIKNLVSYLRSMDNFDDSLALERIINVPKRSIGARTLDRINVFANQSELSFFSVLENIEDVPKINNPTKKRIGKFVELIKKGKKMSEKEDASVQDILYFILKETKYLDQFDKERMSDQERIELIQQLYSMTRDFDKSEKEELEEGQSVIGQFLTETSLYVSEEDQEGIARVQMLTSHSSKGLEAPIVFIIGLEQGIFPTTRALTTEDKEEERRLFYVSMTRAEEILFLSYSSRSYAYGRVRDNHPSVFLSEIPEEHVHWLGQKHEDMPF